MADKTCNFDFEENADKRKGFPYVALMVLEDGKLGRSFFDLDRIYGGKNDVTVEGEYKASQGDIIEIQSGGSWKNKYRRFYAVVDCELIDIGDATGSSKKTDVKKYLKGKLELADLSNEVAKALETAKEKIITTSPVDLQNSIVAKMETATGNDPLLGKQINLRLPNGEKRSAQFAIIELSALIPSHNPFTFADHPDFPLNDKGYNINDRNYGGDTQAQALVQQYAQELRPELLITTSKTPQGSPIVDNSNIVVSGNNRTMSLQLAASKYPERYSDYVTELREEYDSFGFEEPLQSLDNFEHPVLVRIDYDFPEYTTQELAKYNQSEIKGKRPVDKAIELSNILSENSACSTSIPSVLEKYERLSDFYSNGSDQKRMMDLLLGCNLLTPQETSSYYDKQSGFTSGGKDFLEATLSASILDRTAILASDKAGVKALRKIVVTTLPTLMLNKSLSEDRLTDCINDAIIYQMEMVASGLKFGDYVNQKSLFGNKVWNPKSVVLNRLMNLGRNKFKKAIEGYNRSVAGNQQGASLFGDKPDSKEAFEFYVLSAIPEKERELIERFVGKVSAIGCTDVSSSVDVSSDGSKPSDESVIENTIIPVESTDDLQSSDDKALKKKLTNASKLIEILAKKAEREKDEKLAKKLVLARKMIVVLGRGLKA